MTTPITFRELDPDEDYASFHDRVPIPESDRARVERLDVASSRAVWRAVFGGVAPATFDALNDWLSRLRDGGERFRWVDAWEASDYGWAERTLRPHFPWPDETTVLFIWTPDRALQTSFGIFLRHWRAFLFDDEGPLLASMSGDEVAWFWPGSSGVVGRRSAAG